jgi:hypothetical protein
MARDFLDEIVAKRAARNPDFPRMVDEAVERQDRDSAQNPPMGFKVTKARVTTRQRILTARMHRKALV